MLVLYCCVARQCEQSGTHALTRCGWRSGGLRVRILRKVPRRVADEGVLTACVCVLMCLYLRLRFVRGHVYVFCAV